MEVPASLGILCTAACRVATLSEKPANSVTLSPTAKTARRSPGRRTWRMKWAAASCSKAISLWALRLESIISARSSGNCVSDSKTSTFCSTPSSKSWKDSRGKSGAGRLCSSSTLTSTLTRLTLTRMRPRCGVLSCESSGSAAGGLFAVLALLGFCAQGGRLGFVSCAKLVPPGSKLITGNAAQSSNTSNRAGWGVARIARLRCTFPDLRILRDGRKFAVGPDGAVLEIFLLPDRDRALEGVDGIAAGVEGCGPMRGTDRAEDAGVSDFEAAEAVGDGYAVNRELGVNFGGNVAHFGQGHGFVGFVVQIKSTAAVGLIAHAAIEGDDGAVRAGANVIDQRISIDDVAHKQDKIAAGESGH